MTKEKFDLIVGIVVFSIIIIITGLGNHFIDGM